MKINLNNSFTLEDFKKLIATGDDSIKSQYRVTNDGILFISYDVGSKNLDGIRFRVETNNANCSYTGPKAIENENWVNRLYNAIKNNWENHTTEYLDVF